MDHTCYSDHSLVFFKVPFEYQKSQHKIVTLNDYSGINMNDFKNDIASKVDSFKVNQYTNFGDALNEYNTLCHNALKPYVKVKTINVSEEKPKWMDSDFR